MELDTQGPQQTTLASSPPAYLNSPPSSTDSMVTIRLSDEDADNPATSQEHTETATVSHTRRPSSLEIMHGVDVCFDSKPTEFEATGDVDRNPVDTSRGTSWKSSHENLSHRSRSDSSSSETSTHGNWKQLEKTEEQETREEGSDESMAFLLARLEEENNALAVDPKSGIKARARSQSRPPSVHQLKKLIKEPSNQLARESSFPEPPPMTELEFWAALVKDYPQTAQRLPTLTSNKIRSGIPPPLRGVVWVSMAGARDLVLEEHYDRLCGESSPYEGIISKDLGRSFPGVEMFKDPEGEGQKMLGRVLKCFSLYDAKIGYCQGLGFLVGPLLMHMGDKEAFCILVRLMEHYDLRSCFLPDLSGLHLRIYQFQRLLTQHMPTMAAHLQSLQVEAAYLSQWFLSFFAVTCPLPMLFRIYDVIFAEGASETIMRVALSLMRRNESKILGSSEFEDVMQLLLSRALWDPYGCKADDMVDDFMSLGGLVTREALENLQAGFKEAQKEDTGGASGFLPDVQSTASRFLGRLWAPTNLTTKSASLAPGLSAPSRPVSFLRRTPSKQSLTSTLNSISDGSDSTNSIATANTEATTMSRQSSVDCSSLKSNTGSTSPPVKITITNTDKNLHGQIEDLLTALSALQREHRLLATELQREREERAEDRTIARALVDGLTKENRSKAAKDSRRRTVAAFATSPSTSPTVSLLLHNAAIHFSPSFSHRASTSGSETKQQLLSSLAHSAAQLATTEAANQHLARQLAEHDQAAATARDQLRDARARLLAEHKERQRLERTVQALRASASEKRPSLMSSGSSAAETPTLSRGEVGDMATPPSLGMSMGGGLREFKLRRTSLTQSPQSPRTTSTAISAQSTVPQFAKRTSSLAVQQVLAVANQTDQTPIDADALLLELVNAKTAEAVARQEVEELRSRLEGWRRVGGGLGEKRGAVDATTPMRSAETKPSPSPPATSGGGGGFWGWGKRSVSSPAAEGK
ncbi:hypothetical protein B0A49_00243 [Cryomyces minteri]|uniref:Rab-GAP TBC domain-containing protein n=1 Tax=Cryomyces minteri TaxID=331657 RepID=A0A4U0XWD1_9PEZI|nr:hypothetical protein B0A49_00243 [Cryomyces minteri]